MFIDWNEEEFQSTFLQTDTPFTDLEDENLMEHFNSQIELPPLPPTSSVMEPMTDPTSWFCEGSLGAENLNFVPNTLSQSLPNTQLNNPLSSADGLMLDGPVSSVQSPDMTLTDYFNQLSHLQNENSVPPQDDERNSMLQGLIPTRTENNGIEINQPLSHPGLVHPNPGQPRAGNAERSYPSGPLFVPTQTHGFSGFNDTSNSHPAGSSRSEHFQLSASDGYGAQYAPNYSYTQYDSIA
ncbi:unnamed protein product [Sphenostylis stenocarpa]|uniref:Uncharacterized protein n=1 Tax=Sphenostylis stenocarpa TaxID=92480 RepID=A0AA86SWG2_9FABA|nr:unnamed protein product [Sphenostylis stenocarpa]